MAQSPGLAPLLSAVEKSLCMSICTQMQFLGPVTPSQWYVCCRAQEYQNTSSFLLPISCFCLLQVALARPRRVGRQTSADMQESHTRLLGRTPAWRTTLPVHTSVSRNAFEGYGQLQSQSQLLQVSEETADRRAGYGSLSGFVREHNWFSLEWET